MAESEDSAPRQGGEPSFEDELRDALDVWFTMWGDQQAGVAQERDDSAFWLITNQVLVLLAKKAESKEFGALGTLSSHLLIYVATAITQALDGHLPKAWRPRSKAERSERRSVFEVAAVNIAACYHQAIQDGLFADKSHNKFLRETYDVSDRTIGGWIKTGTGERYEPFKRALLSVTGPADKLADLRKDQARQQVRVSAALMRRQFM